MLNLDTHIVLYALQDQLTPEERALMLDDPLCISSIVLWEIAKLAQLKRIDIDLENLELLSLLSRMHTLPISIDVCRAFSQLDFRSDPADEIIAATSIVHNVPLLTRDEKIRRSKKVPLAGVASAREQDV